MNHVLTLICDSKGQLLEREFCQAIATEIGIDQTEWLREGVACDIKIDPNLRHDEVQRLVAEHTAGLKIDAIIQPSENRKKKLLIADMDSTIIEQECIDELAAEVGLKPQVASITEQAMNGEIGFEMALRKRVALLAGLDCEVVAKVLNDCITITPGALELVATMRANSGYCALVSGGFTVFAEQIAGMVGFNEFRANILLSRDGKFTGQVAEPILGQQTKLDTLIELCGTQGMELKDTIAVGDGANDLPMILGAGSGVAFRAKPSVAAKSDININHGDLTALLYLQGYRQEEFAEA